MILSLLRTLAFTLMCFIFGSVSHTVAHEESSQVRLLWNIIAQTKVTAMKAAAQRHKEKLVHFYSFSYSCHTPVYNKTPRLETEHTDNSRIQQQCLLPLFAFKYNVQKRKIQVVLRLRACWVPGFMRRTRAKYQYQICDIQIVCRLILESLFTQWRQTRVREVQCIPASSAAGVLHHDLTARLFGDGRISLLLRWKVASRAYVVTDAHVVTTATHADRLAMSAMISWLID